MRYGIGWTADAVEGCASRPLPVNSSIPPEVREGRLTKSEDSVALGDVYEVGLVSYNLDDLPGGIEMQVGPGEQLEMTFDDGASGLIKVTLTVIG